MKMVVMVVNSILLVMMAGLAFFQTACSPITPSLDRRLFIPKKDPTKPGETSESSAATQALKIEPIISKAFISVSDDIFITDEIEEEESTETVSCTVTELDFDTVELFRKNGQLEIELNDPKAAEFAIGITVASPKEAKALSKEVDVELTATGVPNIWTFELSANQDQKLISKIETTVKSIQWRVCPVEVRAKKLVKDKKNKEKEESMAHKIANKSYNVM